jgi:hypothetical protein
MIVSAMFAMCTKPSYVLSEKKMEKVLYDMYIAEAEMTNNYSIFTSDSVKKRELLNSVLAKHKISKEKLDTSLVWYSAHLEKFMKINEKIEEQYSILIDTLRKREEATMKPIDRNAFDSIPIRLTKKDVILTAKNNLQIIAADTVLSYYGGNYTFRAQIMGVVDSVYPALNFRIQCADTTFVKQDTIKNNGFFTSTVDIAMKNRVTGVMGVIHYPDSAKIKMPVFIKSVSIDKTKIQ